MLDACVLALAFWLAYVARFKAGLPLLDTPSYSGAFYSSVAFWAVPVWVVVFRVYGLYDLRRVFAGLDEYIRVINSSTTGLLAVVFISFLDTTLLISRGWLILTWVLAIVLVCSARFGARRLLRAVRSRHYLVTPTVIVGANEEGAALAEQLLADRSCEAQVIGFLDPSAPAGTPVVGGLRVLGDFSTITDLVQRQGLRQMLVASSALTRDQLLDLFWDYGQDSQLDLRLSSGLYEILTTGVSVHEISNIPLVTLRRVRITGFDALLKILVDYALAAMTLVVLSPVMLVVAVLIHFDSPGPVLHRRRVLGVAGKPFDAFKFRTMFVNADEILAASPDLREAFARDFKLTVDPRVTRIGGFLRRTSLDELPQLINVLRGEMSLVGPRMIAPEEAVRYGKWQRNLFTVKPGITGPWQVQGRSNLAYEQRVGLSMQYIRDYTVWLDLSILVRTIFVVLRGRGAY